MKEGDKLYCKRTLINITIKSEIYFIKNKFYEIKFINDTYLNIIDESGEKWFFAIVDQAKDQYELNDYFISLQQYRKQKLEKLNESR